MPYHDAAFCSETQANTVKRDTSRNPAQLRQLWQGIQFCSKNYVYMYFMYIISSFYSFLNKNIVYNSQTFEILADMKFINRNGNPYIGQNNFLESIRK